MPLPAGKQLGKYQILRPLGRGGMGEVYLARDNQLEREVALKFISPELTGEPDARKRFLREARLASRLNHPAAATIHEVVENDEQLFLAMEYVTGESLRERIRSGPIPFAELLPLARQLVSVLAAAHSQGVIHRDIKPANMMVNAAGHLKLLDFGLATLAPFAPGAEDQPTQTMLTSPGGVAGTPAYLSPERINGLPGDHRADQFAVGLVLYEALSGRHPFAGANPLTTVANILSLSPEPFAKIGTKAPPAFEKLVLRCLAKNPDDRYLQTELLLADLEAVSTDRSFRLSRRHLAATAAVVTVGGGAFLARNYRRGPKFESLAVLPLEPSSPEEAVLAEGLTESLITAFGQIRDLRVLARSAVYNPQVPRKNPLTAGKLLKVAAVLSGRVEAAATGYSIYTELLEVATGRLLWSKVFPAARELLSSLLRDITQPIFALLGAVPEQDASAPVPPEAYQAYLLGRFQLNKRVSEATIKSLTHFEEALRIHPDYALAYMGIAAAFNLQAGIKPPKEVMPKALAAVQRSLALDPRLAEAHAVLGWTRMTFSWDWPGAEASFQEANRLNPSYAIAHANYAYLLACRKRFPDAISHIERAAKLDPLSPNIGVTLGTLYYFSRQNDRAIAHLTKVITAEKRLPSAYFYRGAAHLQAKRYAEAIADYEAGLALTPTDSGAIADLGLAYARAGRVADAQSQLQKLTDLATKRYVASYLQAFPHLGLGDAQRALDLLELAAEERAFPVIFIGIEPKLDPLRNEPRFQRLLSLVGLT
jgi:eukaryotic-like serine/threonine-protein kinase